MGISRSSIFLTFSCCVIVSFAVDTAVETSQPNIPSNASSTNTIDLFIHNSTCELTAEKDCFRLCANDEKCSVVLYIEGCCTTYTPNSFNTSELTLSSQGVMHKAIITANVTTLKCSSFLQVSSNTTTSLKLPVNITSPCRLVLLAANNEKVQGTFHLSNNTTCTEYENNVFFGDVVKVIDSTLTTSSNTTAVPTTATLASAVHKTTASTSATHMKTGIMKMKRNKKISVSTILSSEQTSMQTTKEITASTTAAAVLHTAKTPNDICPPVIYFSKIGGFLILELLKDPTDTVSNITISSHVIIADPNNSNSTKNSKNNNSNNEDSTNSSNSSSDHLGAIIGGSVGGVVVMMAVVAVVMWFKFIRPKGRVQASSEHRVPGVQDGLPTSHS